MRRWLRETVLYRWVGPLYFRWQRRTLRPRKKKGLTLEEAEIAFPAASRCVHCGGWHMHACPRIKVIHFLGENPVQIEFWPWGAWPADQVVFPWQKAALIEEVH